MQDRALAAGPVRTCVGCRARAEKSDLLRVVAGGPSAGGSNAPVLVPDPHRRHPGRGAYLHPDLGCLDLAERRRAFPRALRLPGPLDAAALRQWLEAGRPPGPNREGGGARGRTRRGDGS